MQAGMATDHMKIVSVDYRRFFNDENVISIIIKEMTLGIDHIGDNDGRDYRA